jgi:hypothetical protein
LTNNGKTFCNNGATIWNRISFNIRSFYSVTFLKINIKTYLAAAKRNIYLLLSSYFPTNAVPVLLCKIFLFQSAPLQGSAHVPCARIARAKASFRDSGRHPYSQSNIRYDCKSEMYAHEKLHVAY